MLEIKALLRDLPLCFGALARRAGLAKEIAANRGTHCHEDAGELQPEQAAARVATDLSDLRVELVDLPLSQDVFAASDGCESAVLGTRLQHERDRDDSGDHSQDDHDDNRLRQPDTSARHGSDHGRSLVVTTRRATSRWTTGRRISVA